MVANSDEILHDFSPLLKHYKDGRIERLVGLDVVPPSVDPKTGVQSKDLQISPEINVSARLYLPKNPDRSQKLPLLVYFHGGGFLVESAFSSLYQKHVNCLVAQANVVAVSVDYRLAPEHPLPIAFEDSWLALEWIASQSTDEWIKDYADMNRVFLGGDSAGGNITHNMARRIGTQKLDGINLSGITLNCPFFYGKDPIGNEGADHFIFSKNYNDRLLPYVCPSMSDCDEPWINPAKDEKLSSLGCKKVLVYVAEKDFLKDRGCYYKEILSKSGWNGDVELVEVEGEDHVFSVLHPDSENGNAMLKKVASFINE
ncbi:Arylacetamide deacetylase [Handroanthus impetiginosus]|uniref:Arylacetamide deacetylase n=1 Tax=Handroanthus impetiginosus TaxID=429701 RepID=A0A2G9HCQ5_9LAMI|nr:Arylacetamide deacetylase [Handroanthus impetiginosus]